MSARALSPRWLRGPHRRCERRLLATAALGALVIAGIAAKLWSIQIQHADRLQAEAREQYQDKIELLPDRGKIVDRQGNVLAVSLDCVSVVANPSQIQDVDATIDALSRFLRVRRPVLRKKLTEERQFTWLERKVNPEVGAAVECLALPGVYTVPDKERRHPAGNCLAAVVGTTDIDGNGTEGIELRFDSALRGEKGYRILQRVPGMDARPNLHWRDRCSEPGRSVVLTLDLRIQRIVESVLARTVKRARARRGLAVVMDPRNGDVLAMAVVGNRARSGRSPRPTMNLITGSQFEPGSTFKVVTFAAALESGAFDGRERLDAEGGVWRCGSMTLHDEEKHDYLTFRDAFAHSSNICSAKIAIGVGEEEFYRMSRRFGFGNRSGVDLPGEIPGLLHRPSEWSRRSLPTLGFGHEVSVTALQLAGAYAAVANGGTLWEPRIVKEIVDREGETVRSYPARPVRRVVSEETARTLRELMEQVVVEGTAKAAYLERWGIAGKTGTARKAGRGSGYDQKRFVASFAGFFPAWDPGLVAVVIVDEPQWESRFGGAVAAPAFREIAEQLVNTSAVPMIATRDPLVGPTPSRDAFDGWGGFRNGVEPVAETAPDPRRGVVPDLRGVTLRLAVSSLRQAGFDPAVEGSGIVRDQDPAPGSKPGEGARVVVRARAPGDFAAVLGVAGRYARTGATR